MGYVGNLLRIVGATVAGLAALAFAWLAFEGSVSTLQETTAACIGVAGVLLLILGAVSELIAATEAAAKQAHADAVRLATAIDLVDVGINRVRIKLGERKG